MPKKSLNYYWRLFATGLSYVFFGLGVVVVGVLFRLVSVTRVNSATKQRWIKTAIHKGCLFYINTLRALGVLTYSHSLEQLNQQARSSVVISNHPGLLDAIFLLALCKNLTCIVKAELSRNPFTANVVKLAGYIPTDSETFMEHATARLAAGEHILIFPEGTRNTADDQLEFKRGAANLVVVAQCPIVPVLIRCVPRSLQKGAKWYNIPHKAGHFSLQSNAPLELSECIDVASPRTIQYRRLTKFLIAYYRNWLGVDAGKHQASC